MIRHFAATFAATLVPLATFVVAGSGGKSGRWFEPKEAA